MQITLPTTDFLSTQARFVLLSLLLPPPRLNRNHNHQTRNHQRKCNGSYKRNAASARRELATDNPMLALEVAIEAYEQHHYADPQEGCTKWLTHVS